MSDQDLNNIKAIDQLADSTYDSRMNTFIAISPFTVRDMNMNFNAEIRSDMMAKQIDLFFPDVTRPEISSAIMNLNEGSLTLIFSETVKESTLDLTQFSLQDNLTVIRYLIIFTIKMQYSATSIIRTLIIRTLIIRTLIIRTFRLSGHS